MTTLLNGRFADPTNDFAFKRIFGTEQYKDATIGLLNSIFPELDIVDVEFPENELIGETAYSRKGFIDVLCIDSGNRNFIVEMQNARQEHFRERAVFYSSKLITRQAPAGKWDYSLMPTYVVAFLNFSLKSLGGDAVEDGQFILRYVSREASSGRKMPGSTEFVFLGLKDFEKSEDELQSIPEKWIYLLKNTLSFNEIPDSFKSDKAFGSFFCACERAGFSKEEDAKYTRAMMNEWDIQNAKDLAVRESREEGREEGRIEGREEGRIEGREEGETKKSNEVARKMLEDGMPFEVISKYTGLSQDQIESLK